MCIPKWSEVLIAAAVMVAPLACDLGLSAKVDQRYATYQEAVDAGALHGASFIPWCTPKSATDIHDVHDADNNTGRGSFKFNPDDARDFAEAIAEGELSETQRGSLKIATRADEKAYRVESNCPILLYVDWKAGRCRYWLEPK